MTEKNNRNTVNFLHTDTVAGTFNRLRSEAYEIDRSTGEIIGVKNERVRQLYDDVLEGRKKPNAAAVEAGNLLQMGEFPPFVSGKLLII